MASYFVREFERPRGRYVALYRSAYDELTKKSRQRVVRAGYVEELALQGIKDPLAALKAEAKELKRKDRLEREAKKRSRVGDTPPIKNLGYFLLKAINEGLGVRRDFEYLQLMSGARYSFFELLCALVYSRVVEPRSKLKTFERVMPRLFEDPGVSLDQLYDGLAFLGREYRKVVDLYNRAVAAKFGRDTSTTFFDCTNFYFEIDLEDDLRKKGPSKEHRPCPLVGLGLLLDADKIPVAFDVFAGNESEKPVLRDVISRMKRRGAIEGRTVQVADKGLNCARNIDCALRAKDGYLFSRSVKTLSATELTWVLNDADWSVRQDVRGKELWRMKECVDVFEYSYRDQDGKPHTFKALEKRVVNLNAKLRRKQLAEINKLVAKAKGLCASRAKSQETGSAATFITFTALSAEGEIEEGSKVATTLNRKAIEKARRLAGYNMFVTSETSMEAQQIYDTYHMLWRIEESFRVMKSELDARPVFLSKPDAIKGHFLVCYIAVLLLRLLQFKVLGPKVSSSRLVELISTFNVVKASERRYINLASSSELLDELEERFQLPLTSADLSKGDISAALKLRI